MALSTPVFSALFDRPDKTYRAGETVKYKIILVVPRTLVTLGLNVIITGTAFFYDKQKSITATKNFYKDTFEGIPDNTTLTIGRYEYEASFRLPFNIPASFSHPNGFIGYSIKTFYNRISYESIASNERFIVEHTLSLAAYPSMVDWICDKGEKTFTCCFNWGCWYQSQPLRVTTSLLKSLYEVGNTINIAVKVDNASDVAVKSTVLKVVEELAFCIDNEDEKRSHRILFIHHFNTPVAPSQKKMFLKSFFLDPDLNLILSTKSRIVTCSYYVFVETVMKGGYSGLKVLSQIYITKHFETTESVL